MIKRQQNSTNSRTRDWSKAFLSALATTGVVLRACEAVGVERTTVWRRRKDDPDFAQAYKEAQHTGALLLEAEAIRRARDGLVRKQFTKAGVPIIDPATGEQYVEYQYSDHLLMMLLKRYFPDKYREAATQVNIQSNTNILVLSEAKRAEILERRRLAAGAKSLNMRAASPSV